MKHRKYKEIQNKKFKVKSLKLYNISIFFHTCTINKLNLAKKVILTTGTFRTEAKPKYGLNESKIELDENIAIHRNFGESFHL
jgi:hypothetical protein